MALPRDRLPRVALGIVRGEPLGSLFLGESPSPGLAAALAMILAGLAIAQGRSRVGARAVGCDAAPCDIASRSGP